MAGRIPVSRIAAISIGRDDSSSGSDACFRTLAASLAFPFQGPSIQDLGSEPGDLCAETVQCDGAGEAAIDVALERLDGEAAKIGGTLPGPRVGGQRGYRRTKDSRGKHLRFRTENGRAASPVLWAKEPIALGMVIGGSASKQRSAVDAGSQVGEPS